MYTNWQDTFNNNACMYNCYLRDNILSNLNDITLKTEGGLFRQDYKDIDKIMELINSRYASIYSELRGYRMNYIIVNNIFRALVSFTVSNASKYTGTVSQKTDAIFNDFIKQYPWVRGLFLGYGVPLNRANTIMKTIIRFTLENLSDTTPKDNWSRWENLGGINISSAPAAASWARNRLDVFAMGENRALWHKWWDGVRWNNWEDLSGVITSAPAAVSWGPNRIDVFARGTNNAMWHKWWNGSNWSGWEDLGGIITSPPAAASWAPNRIDCFARGTNNALWHKWWDGTRWSNWEDLGGVLTSAPAAVSWGPNRIDVFTRGTNNAMWHKWWDGARWSNWEDLGGRLTSAPAAASWAPNRIDCFARDINNQLIHKFWNGSRWSNWQNIGGLTLTSAPAAVSWGPNRIDVFARGTNNKLWHIWRS
ncbi:hypothetical protein CLOACE_08350 [Clostridium acetireducens DSM 10703]|uniref:PLL-like beta propeller domain-containing protein n=1 Tax=Clostridium acetireducens DSM 10703 TaxID=1121290 RepID=A0A1E8EZT7_9CLOT|nr:DUF346 domain-containing protein [Clostridium acetireducens]OFI06680.1 hypothetical protein CLOACE_08350 [Clostridium acetireducens DSM 10703]